ncbi:MAG TPA: FtsX-like permease family protein, partial [Thermomicrobiales bacterium]|nr:FtsX-like permease family protein [Thermomicrobiales bacterium]
MLSRRGNVLGSLVALALAVAVMLAALTVMLSTFRGPGVTDRLSAPDLIVRPDLQARFDVAADDIPSGLHIRIPASDIDVIAASAGVECIVSDVTFAAQVLDANGAPVTASDDAVPRGQSWDSAALTPFTIEDGRAPEGTDEIVLDRATSMAAGLSIGDETRVATSQSVEIYRVVGIAVPPKGDALNRQSSIFFAPGVSRDVSGTDGEADLVGVFLAPGADIDAAQNELRSALEGRDLEVLAGPDRGKADVTAGAEDVAELGIVLGVLCGFVGFVAVFVLISTFGFSIQQREREIGIQRAMGYTPGQVRRAILFEALVIAVAGAALGAVSGLVLARIFTRFAIWFGKAPAGFTVEPSGLAMVIVLGAAPLIALLAAWFAARRTSRIRPIEALRTSSAPSPWIGWRRFALGFLVVSSSFFIFALAPALPPDGAISISLLVTVLLTIGCAVLGPSLFALIVRMASPLWWRGGITGEIAISNMERMARRVASAAMPVLLGVSFMVLMFGFTRTIENGTIQITDGREISDLHVVPTAIVLPEDAAARVESVEGVESAWPIVNTSLVYDWEDTVLTADVAVISPEALPLIENLDFSAGGIDGFEAGSIIISNMLDTPAKIGDTISLYLEDGMNLQVTVAGEATNMIGLGDIILSPEDVAGHLMDSSPSFIAVKLMDDVDTDGVAGEIDALRAEGYPLQALTHSQFVAGVQQSLQQGVWATYLIVGAAASFGMIAAINTTVMATAERAREFALMRLIGATSGHILRMLAQEAMLAGLAGVVLGWAIALASTVPVSIGLVGDASAISVPILPAIVTGLLAMTIVLISTLLPGMSALRRVPITEIGRKE